MFNMIFLYMMKKYKLKTIKLKKNIYYDLKMNLFINYNFIKLIFDLIYFKHFVYFLHLCIIRFYIIKITFIIVY